MRSSALREPYNGSRFFCLPCFIFVGLRQLLNEPRLQRQERTRDDGADMPSSHDGYANNRSGDGASIRHSNRDRNVPSLDTDLHNDGDDNRPRHRHEP
jgi:hypothetical protein